MQTNLRKLISAFAWLGRSHVLSKGKGCLITSVLLSKRVGGEKKDYVNTIFSLPISNCVFQRESLSSSRGRSKRHIQMTMKVSVEI